MCKLINLCINIEDQNSLAADIEQLIGFIKDRDNWVIPFVTEIALKDKTGRRFTLPIMVTMVTKLYGKGEKAVMTANIKTLDELQGFSSSLNAKDSSVNQTELDKRIQKYTDSDSALISTMGQYNKIYSKFMESASDSIAHDAYQECIISVVESAM